MCHTLSLPSGESSTGSKYSLLDISYVHYVAYKLLYFMGLIKYRRQGETKGNLSMISFAIFCDIFLPSERHQRLGEAQNVCGNNNHIMDQIQDG